MLTRRKWTLFVAGALGVVICLEPLVHRGTLVDPIHPVLRAIGIGVGIFFGLYLTIIRFRSSKIDSWKSGIAIIAVPVFGGILGSYYARNAVECLSFAATSPVHSEIIVEVISTSSGGRGGPFAEVLPYAGARVIQVRISEELFQSIGYGVRKCLKLNIQTGRNGVKRMLLPNVFDDFVGVDRLAQCRASVST